MSYVAPTPPVEVEVVVDAVVAEVLFGCCAVLFALRFVWTLLRRKAPD
jgi:hypothetical protein